MGLKLGLGRVGIRGLSWVRGKLVWDTELGLELELGRVGIEIRIRVRKIWR